MVELDKERPRERAALDVVRVAKVCGRGGGVKDHEQARARGRKQRQANVVADLIGRAVVLAERLYEALRRERPVEAQADQVGVEIAYGQTNKVRM